MLSKKLILMSVVLAIVSYIVSNAIWNAEIFNVRDQHEHTPDATTDTAKPYLHFDERTETSIVMIFKCTTIAIVNIVLVLAFIVGKRIS